MALLNAANATISEQLDREKRSVSYDSYDITVRQLIDMIEGGELNIAPDYQRHFIWDEGRESELIESIYLGIPVPSLYMATNKDGTWEVVDGVQRLSTLIHFCGHDVLFKKIRRTQPLRLCGLKKLSSFNDMSFNDLPTSVQLTFTLRPIRVTTLNDKSDLKVRYDLFERLNTGGVVLHPHEIRNCVYHGPFKDCLKRLSRDVNFRSVVKLKKTETREAMLEECVLRLFAFLNRYKDFEHSVVNFLNDYMNDMNEKRLSTASAGIFEKTFVFLAEELPRGIVRGNGTTTPINLYEGVAVGTALALQQTASPKRDVLTSAINDPELKALTQGGTNTNRMVVGRIEFIRDALV